MLDMTLAAIRDRERLRQIISVLARFGVQDVFIRLGLGDLFNDKTSNSSVDTPSDTTAEGQSAPQRMRMAIEALGPTFIKLGQILATRGDLLPAEWTEEFERLHSRVASVPWSDMREQVVADLAAPVEDVFASFDTEPLASASMAQVYRARLHDGQDVVVKVQRPGLRRTVEADLRLLAQLANIVEERKLAPYYKPRDIVRHLTLAMQDELDFRREAQSCEQVARNFEQHPEIEIPRIYSEWSSERLLVQSYVDGIAPTDDSGLRAQGLDRSLLAERGARAFLKMVLHDGLFHADPHPGNLIVLAENRVGFIDFGMVGRLSDLRRDQLLVLFRSIVSGRADGLINLLMDWSGPTDFNWLRAEQAVQEFVTRTASAPLSLKQALNDFMEMAKQSRVAVPPDLALLVKAFATADGVLQRLDPQFNIVQIAGPMVKRALLRRYSPRTIQREALGALVDVQTAALDLPQLLRLVMLRLKHGHFMANIKIANLDRLGTSLERAATRLAIAIVTAAVLLALGPVLLQYGPRWMGMPAFAWFGLLAAVAGLITLFWTFRRRR